MILPLPSGVPPANEDGLASLEHMLERAGQGLQKATRTLLERQSDSSSSSPSATCGPAGSSKCITPASEASDQNLAVILGVVIPLACAALVLIFLHRRHTRKLKQEDISDPHKSLDFGLDGIEPAVSKRSKKHPEMSVSQIDTSGKPSRRGLGMSMDMGLGSPYLLPAGLTGSHDSLHSMSRSIMDEHDPYRPVNLMRPSTDNDSIRRGRLDDQASTFSASTDQYSAFQDRAGLVTNARPMSQSFAPRNASLAEGQNGLSFHDSDLDKHLPSVDEKDMPPLPTPPEPVAHSGLPRSSSMHSAGGIPRPPRKDSMSTIHTTGRPDSSNYGDDVPPAPVASGPTINEPEPYDINPAMIYTGEAIDLPSHEPSPTTPAGFDPSRLSVANRLSVMNRLSVVGGQNRLSVMGVRPLPPDIPEDSPEVRANRIRSFYKEYFDDSKPNPANATYEEGSYMDVLDGVIFDPDTGGFYAPTKPFAQGPARRAMTPPPRSRPRVSGNSMNPHARQFSTMSAGRPGGRAMPKKNLPPPKPLQHLMTPHLMKDDSSIFNAIDFAPPTTFRDMQNASRPSTPGSRSFTPLVSSFDDLLVLPSPHDLRKSGTFTALDFAPASKMLSPMLPSSDAGSIRSNRTGISPVQNNAIKSGAYRVSRIPKNMVTTKEDLMTQLRPQMNMTTPA